MKHHSKILLVILTLPFILMSGCQQKVVQASSGDGGEWFFSDKSTQCVGQDSSDRNVIVYGPDCLDSDGNSPSNRGNLFISCPNGTSLLEYRIYHISSSHDEKLVATGDGRFKCTNLYCTAIAYKCVRTTYR